MKEIRHRKRKIYEWKKTWEDSEKVECIFKKVFKKIWMYVREMDGWKKRIHFWMNEQK